MTRMLFQEDPYLREAPARVIGHTVEGGIVLDSTVFYPKGGGQPGDSGTLEWDGKRLAIATAVKGEGAQIVLVPSEPAALPPVGCHLVQSLDWDRRHKHMRVHTALHLLSVAVPFGVTGGAISATHGRLDFDMPDAPDDRDALEDALNEYVELDARSFLHFVSISVIRVRSLIAPGFCEYCLAWFILLCLYYVCYL